MDSHDAHQPSAEDSRAGIRNFVIFTFGLLLLVAWHVYDGFKHPEVRSAHFLRGGLLFLLGVLFWVHRLIREGLAFKARRGRSLDRSVLPCSRCVVVPVGAARRVAPSRGTEGTGCQISGVATDSSPAERDHAPGLRGLQRRGHPAR